MMKKILFLLLTLLNVSWAMAEVTEPVHWSSAYVQKGDLLKINFSAKIDDSFHLYAMDVPEDGPQKTEFHYESLKGLTQVGEPVVTEGSLVTVMDDIFEMEISYFEKSVVFTQTFEVTDEYWELDGYILFMSCNAEMCTPPTSWEWRFSQSRSQLTKVVQVDDTLAAGAAAQSDSTATAVAPAAAQSGSDDSDGGFMGMLWIFVAGFLAGLLALVTPCVWPMIPMTVSFFLKRTKDRSQSIRDAYVYGISIIVIYVLLGLVVTAIFGASALNSLATNAVFNVIFFLLLVVFAFSFFGAFEIALPASWTTKLDEKADATTGFLSIFFMAFTLCLVSFSCTGPIIGTLLVQAATSGSMLYPAIGMTGFALALSLPFTLFALFPSMLKSMPKSGGWLNMVKVVLGFCELALSLKFLSVADLAYGWGILDREVFLCLWIVIFLFLGLYLLGFIRLPHDDDPKPSDRVSVTRLTLAILSFAFAIYMIPGLWGAPCKAISAFTPPMSTQDFRLGDDGITTYHDYDEGMAAARRAGKPVMVDFSGYGCVNCRKMEASVWTDREVKQIIENEYILIELMVDDKTSLPQVQIVNENGRDVKLRTVGDRWSYLQRSQFGANAQPYYVLLNHDGKLLTESYSYNEDVPSYIQFLKRGLEAWKK